MSFIIKRILTFGIKKEVNAVLKSLINGITFYNSSLDMNKLQQAVKNGVNYYTEE